MNKWLSLGLIVLLVSGVAVFARSGLVSSDTHTPEKYTTDLAGNSKTTFTVGEQGYLNLKIYAESIAASADKADVVLALDASGSMDTVVGSTTKLAQAKEAIKAFIGNIQDSDDMKVALVLYGGKVHCSIIDPAPEGVAATYYPLTLMNDTNRSNFSSQVDALDAAAIQTSLGTSSCYGSNYANRNTGVGSGMDSAINILNGAPSRGAKKAAVLLTDGQENSTPYANTNFFAVAAAADRLTAVVDNSPIDKAIKNDVSFFTIHYGSTGSACRAMAGPFASPPADGSGGCALMRFIAAKTNNQVIPTGKTFSSDYKQISGVDEKFFYKTASADELELIYKNILNEIAGAAGVPINVYEKLSTNATYGGFISAIDKGGRSYSPAESDGSKGEKVYAFNQVPKSYFCNAGESACNAQATKSGSTYTISDNYIIVKIKFTANSSGEFDMDSNRSQCGASVTEPVSKVEMLDPQANNKVRDTYVFPELCLHFVDRTDQSMQIIKKTYGSPQGDDADESQQKAFFDSGDKVYVRLEVFEPNTTRTQYEIKDEVPPTVSGEIQYNLKRMSDGTSYAGKASVSVENGHRSLKIIGATGVGNNLLNGKNIIQYSYEM